MFNKKLVETREFSIDLPLKAAYVVLKEAISKHDLQWFGSWSGWKSKYSKDSKSVNSTYIFRDYVSGPAGSKWVERSVNLLCTLESKSPSVTLVKLKFSSADTESRWVSEEGMSRTCKFIENYLSHASDYETMQRTDWLSDSTKGLLESVYAAGAK